MAMTAEPRGGNHEQSRKLAADARRIWLAGVRAVSADGLFRRWPLQELIKRPLEQYRRIFVLAFGKAALGMAGEAQAILGARLTGGMIVVPHGYVRQPLPEYLHAPTAPLAIAEAGHPLPDAAGEAAALRALELAADCGPDDLLIILISGGGSALMSAFQAGISLADAQATFSLLLKSGADIHELNTVRKHISRVGGGRLAVAASRGEVVALALSDVLGDDLSVIASGPTVPDPTTFTDARNILEARELWSRLPESVRGHIERGLADASLETPKPGDPRLAGVTTRLFGTLRLAMAAAEQEARSLGYEPHTIMPLTGDACETGAMLAENTRMRHARAAADEPVCLLGGGETTVTVRGAGCGGRNQEMALAYALAMERAAARPATPYVFLAAGSDGVDGIAPPGGEAVAGGLIDDGTLDRARAAGADPEALLRANDSYRFFSDCGGHFATGPTHTNVMDLQVALVASKGRT